MLPKIMVTARTQTKIANNKACNETSIPFTWMTALCMLIMINHSIDCKKNNVQKFLTNLLSVKFKLDLHQMLAKSVTTINVTVVNTVVL